MTETSDDVSHSTSDCSRSTSVVVVVVVVVAESGVTRICGSRTALQTGRHELRRLVNLVADCDDRRCLDDEVTEPERVSGDLGLQTVDLRDSVDGSALSELSAAGCSKNTQVRLSHLSCTLRVVDSENKAALTPTRVFFYIFVENVYIYTKFSGYVYE